MSRRTIRGTLGGLAAGLLLAAPADAGFTGGLTDPSYSPSGKRIVFTDLKQGGDREIVTIRPNGKDLKRLTKNDASDVDPAWTPNGKRILFSSNRDGEYDIYSMRRDGTHVHHVTDTDDVEEFGPSQAGKRIAFEQEIGDDGQIWSVKSDGSDPVQLTETAGFNYAPSFAPDHSAIAFTSDRDGETNVYSMDPAGMTEVPLTENLESDGDSSFSPRSKRITFESRRDGTDAEIVTMKANGDGEEQLTENSDFDGDPAYSPSGKKVVFVGTDGSEYQLYSIRASDGKKRHQITHYK